jgi:hypothetical protein
VRRGSSREISFEGRRNERGGAAREKGVGNREQGAIPNNMNNDDTFENLEVWKEAIELAARVYELFRECKDWGFRGQIQDAVVSVSNRSPAERLW